MATGWNLDFGADQHQGAREEQQDFFASSRPTMDVVESDAGFLGIVADGMGGMAGGAQASLFAVNTFMEDYRAKSPAETVPEALNRALYQANSAVVEANRHVPEDQASGTTLVAGVIQGPSLHWVSVGDSSLLLYRDGALQAVNEDHSYGAELDAMLAAGEISPEQAQAEAGKRHGLTSYLGLERIPKINLSRLPVEVKVGDKILICSDGLLNALSAHEINEVLGKAFSAQEKCELLIKSALAKRDPYQDNITLILLELNRAEEAAAVAAPPVAAGAGRGKLYAALGGVALLAVIAVAAWLFLLKPPPVEPTPPGPKPTTATGPVTTTKPAPGVTTTTSPTVPTVGPESPTESKAVPLVDCENPYCQQAILKALLWYDGDIDGMVGGGTKEAIEKFQKRRDLAILSDEYGKMNGPTCTELKQAYQDVSAKLVDSGAQSKKVSDWCAMTPPEEPPPKPIVIKPRPRPKRRPRVTQPKKPATEPAEKVVTQPKTDGTVPTTGAPPSTDSGKPKETDKKAETPKKPTKESKPDSDAKIFSQD